MYLTLSEYLNGAVKLISKYGHQSMLRSEDDISSVASAMMKADSKYNDKIGTRNGYRVRYGRYMISSLINKYKHNKRKYKTISISTKVSQNENKDVYLGDIIAIDKMGPDDTAFTNELVNIIKNADYLSSREKYCLYMRYIGNMSLKSIGADLSISRQAVHLNIVNAISKVKSNVY